jgi:hypothetical protein
VGCECISSLLSPHYWTLLHFTIGRGATVFTPLCQFWKMRRSPAARSTGSSKIPRLGALVLLAAFVTFANYSYYHKVCPRPGAACRQGRLDSPGMRAATRRANVDGQKRPSWRLVDNCPAAVHTRTRAQQDRAGDPKGRVCGELEMRVEVNSESSSHRSQPSPLNRSSSVACQTLGRGMSLYLHRALAVADIYGFPASLSLQHVDGPLITASLSEGEGWLRRSDPLKNGLCRPARKGGHDG